MGEMIELADGEFSGYRAEAQGDLLRGALIVIHEIWGLVPHIKDVADRFAAQGYLVVAPDLLSGIGLTSEVGLELNRLQFGVATDEERAIAQPLMREKTSPMRSPEYAAWAIASLKKVVDYLELEPGLDGRIGVVGFCFGGTYSFALAAADPRVKAAVPFYGAPPEHTDMAAIQGDVLAFYGETDERLMESLPAVDSGMRAAGAQWLFHVYEGAGHAFFNDTNPVMYRPDAATDAWSRTLEFLRGTLIPTIAE